MSNIMITKTCNLNCPYCFANQFVNKERDVISLENFHKALDFLTRTERHVGLIGGEPTTHPRFEELLKTLQNDSRIQEVTVYTNGILMNNFLDILSDPKFHMLINLNSPKLLGEKRYKAIDRMLDRAINQYGMKEQVSLGINLDSPDLDYSYIIEMCKKYNYHTLRVAICVPNSDKYRNYSSLKWFRTLKPLVFKFFKELFANGVVPHFDCNYLPTCVLEPEELDWLSKAQQLAGEYNIQTNLLDTCKSCNPVIDILPDLSLVRCFGMSHDLQLNISQFNNLDDVRNYIENRIDIFKFVVHSNPECKNCEETTLGKCTGGCLAYKAEKITKAYSYCNSLNEEG